MGSLTHFAHCLMGRLKFSCSPSTGATGTIAFLVVTGKWKHSLTLLVFSIHDDFSFKDQVGLFYKIQYDGSNDDLDWRLDFKYLNFVCIIKHLRPRVIKGCFIE